MPFETTAAESLAGDFPNGGGLTTQDPMALGYLYTETLFAVPDSNLHIPSVVEGNSETPVAPAIPYFGGFQAGVLFLSHVPGHAWLAEPAMDAFQKSISALGLSHEQIGLVNLAALSAAGLTVEPGELLAALHRQFQPKKLIIHGVEANQLGLSPEQLPLHQVCQLPQLPNTHILATYAFEEMFEQVEKKRTYWQHLKSFLQ